MNVLQLGVAKSGNLWLYRLLENILDHAGEPRRSFVQQQPIYALAQTWPMNFTGQAGVDTLNIRADGCWAQVANSRERLPLANVDEYIRRCRHVWSHSPCCARSLDVLPKFDKVVYIVRDPRDVVISRSQFVFLPARVAIDSQRTFGHDNSEQYLANEFERGVRNWVSHVGGYLQHQMELRLHIVFYERLLQAFDTELQSLADYLGVTLDRRAIEHIKAAVSFATMKLQDAGHVRRGRAGEWRSVLSDAHKQRAIHVAGPLLELLGYPLHEWAAGLPQLPAPLNSRDVIRAMLPLRPPLIRRVWRRARAIFVSEAVTR